jgi:hypothetical protein
MAHLSLSSFFKSKGPVEMAAPIPEMIECPRCGRFFHGRGHDHEPLCKDCWKLTKHERPA